MMYVIRLLFAACIRLAGLLTVWLYLPTVTFLPGWVLNLLAYVVYFFLTFGFTLFVLRHREPTHVRTIVVWAVFILVELLVPMAVHVFIGKGDPRDMLAIFRFETVFLFALYAFAAFFARDQLRAGIEARHATEGLVQ